MIRTAPQKPEWKPHSAPPLSLVLHLPVSSRLSAWDGLLTGVVILGLGMVLYLVAVIPASSLPVEETLVLIEEVPPPKRIEIAEPALHREPPPARMIPSTAKLEAPAPTPASPLPVFGLQDDELSDQGDMASATGNTLAARPDSVVQVPPPPLPPAPVELDRAPGFLRQSMAQYPEWAQDQGIEAVVLVWVTVGTDGKVMEASIKRSGGKHFDANAIQAARSSLFQPLVRNGVKVACRFVVTYDFKLES